MAFLEVAAVRRVIAKFGGNPELEVTTDSYELARLSLERSIEGFFMLAKNGAIKRHTDLHASIMEFMRHADKLAYQLGDAEVPHKPISAKRKTQHRKKKVA